MMRKIAIGLTLLIITLTAAGCGVPQKEYDTVVSNLTQTTQELNTTKTQLALIEQELETTKTRLAQAQEELADVQLELISVAGTIWTGWESDGDYYEFYFMKNGSLHYKSPTGYWTVATWRQDGNEIYMEFNNKYAERQGTITGNRMEGDGWNVKGLRWTWSAER